MAMSGESDTITTSRLESSPSNPAVRQPIRRVFVVLNTSAGGNATTDIQAAIDEIFTEFGLNYEVYETTNAGDIPKLSRRAIEQGHDLLVAAGGDGTIAAVADALIGTSIPLGVIPAGTANVLARELGLPLDPRAACRVIAEQAATRTIDAMRIGNRHFLFQVGIGIDALMIRDTNRIHKQRFGRLAYLFTAFTRLLGFQPRRFLIETDGKRHKRRASQVLIANGGVFGMPPYVWGPNIRLDDERLDVCVVHARTLFDYLGLFWDLFLGRTHANRNMRYYHAEHSIRIATRKHLPVQADGELIGHTPIHVVLVPHAVTFIVRATRDADLLERVGAFLDF